MTDRPFNTSPQNSDSQNQSPRQIPADSVTLPSKGKIYELDHPFCNEESVEIRCMTAREEDLLTSKALIKNGTVIERLLEACILNKSVNASTLLLGDRHALLISIRVSGYGAAYEVKVSCPSCSEEFDHTFDLSKLAIKPLGAEPDEPNKNQFSVKLPSGNVIKFKLATGGDEDEITQAVNRKKKLGAQIEETMTLRLKQTIISVNGEMDRAKISSMVDNMRASEARALRGYINKISPNVDLTQQTKCPHCSEENSLDIPLGATFFWPDFGK